MAEDSTIEAPTPKKKEYDDRYGLRQLISHRPRKKKELSESDPQIGLDKSWSDSDWWENKNGGASPSSLLPSPRLVPVPPPRPVPYTRAVV